MTEMTYQVVYLTDETAGELRRRLGDLCQGAWCVRRMGLGLLSRGRRQYRVFFERERDVRVLLGAATAAA